MTISTPKQGTGISHTLVEQYDYTLDMAWANPQDPSHAHFPKFSYLTQYAVQVSDQFFLRDKTTGRWTPYGKEGDARRILMNQRGGTQTLSGVLQTITADDIKLFF